MFIDILLFILYKISGLEVPAENEVGKEHFTFPSFTPTLFFFALLPP